MAADPPPLDERTLERLAALARSREANASPCPEAEPLPEVSIVVPVLDEGDGLERLYQALAPVLDLLAPCELVLVDDGSRDDSWDRMRGLAERDARIRLVRMAGHHGQHLALAAGLDFCRGTEAAFVFDADLQNDPRDVPKLRAALRGGHDYVSGRRRERHDSRFRRLTSRLANRLVRRLCRAPFRDQFSPLKGFSRELVEAMRGYGTERRSLPVLAGRLSRNPLEIDVRHAAREGASRYSIAMLCGMLWRCAVVSARLSRRNPGPPSRATPYAVAERL